MNGHKEVWASCPDCKWTWIVAHLPLPVETVARLMKRAQCPKCGKATGIKMASDADIAAARGENWRGIGKLAEECGEVLQLIGKAIPFPTGPHPDGQGALRDRLPAELSDLKAAIAYFEEANGLAVDDERVARKLALFREWGLTGVHDLRGGGKS